jgi:putative DNA primase/helicase
MGRRIKLIPFLIQIPSHERDEHLGDKLKAEASGILNWMLQGLSAWRANGRKLIEPREVSEAVGACRSNNDPFGAFLSERIEPNDAEKAVVNDVYSAYRFWAEGNGEKEMLSAREFGMAMAGRGYISKPSNGKRFYVGCSLRGWGGASDEASQGDGEHGKLNSEEFKVWADSLLT